MNAKLYAKCQPLYLAARFPSLIMAPYSIDEEEEEEAWFVLEKQSSD